MLFQRLGLGALAFVVSVVVVMELRDGSASIKSGPDYLRETEPGKFWATIVLHTAVVALALGMALRPGRRG